MNSHKTDFEPLTKLLDDFCTCGESYCVSHRLELGIEKVMEAYLLQESKALVEAIKQAIKVTMRTSEGAFAERLDETYTILNCVIENFQKKHGGV